MEFLVVLWIFERGVHLGEDHALVFAEGVAEGEGHGESNWRLEIQRLEI